MSASHKDAIEIHVRALRTATDDAERRLKNLDLAEDRTSGHANWTAEIDAIDTALARIETEVTALEAVRDTLATKLGVE